MEDFYNSSKRKYNRTKPVLPVYQFDLEGNLIYMHASMEVAAENLMISKSAIVAAINRKGCYDKKWYFSRDRKFVVPVKKYNRNPLLAKKAAAIKMPDLPEFIIDPYSEEEDFQL
jgi:hypothetical protein